ncbi:MAG: hypothetical protein ACXACU_03310 [Candidatus Hodarchaeales archaeon]
MSVRCFVFSGGYRPQCVYTIISTISDARKMDHSLRKSLFNVFFRIRGVAALDIQ